MIPAIFNSRMILITPRTLAWAATLALTVAQAASAATPYDADFAVLRSSSSSYEETRAAARHLQGSQDPVVIEFWLSLLQPNSPARGQGAAREALESLARSHALPADTGARLVRIIQTNAQSSPYSASAARDVLKGMIRSGDQSIVPSIIEVLDHQHPSVDSQIQFLSVLSDAKDTRASATLIRLSGASDLGVKEAAIEGLGSIVEASPDARARLRALIAQEQSPSIQRRAIQALRDLRYSRNSSWIQASDVKETLQVLAARLDDSDLRVRQEAAESLILILSRLTSQHRTSAATLNRVADCFSEGLDEILGDRNHSQASNGTLLMFDLLFFGGAPVMTLTDGVRDHQKLSASINASVAQPWNASDLAALQAVIQAI